MYNGKVIPSEGASSLKQVRHLDNSRLWMPIGTSLLLILLLIPVGIAAGFLLPIILAGMMRGHGMYFGGVGFGGGSGGDSGGGFGGFGGGDFGGGGASGGW